MDHPSGVEQIWPAMASLPDVAYSLCSCAGSGGHRSYLVARHSGLYRSGDGGATWRPVASPATDRTVISIAVSPDFERDGTLLAGVRGGVMRSIDHGAQWTDIPLQGSPLPSSLVLSPCFADDGLVFAGTTTDGVYRSDDRGARWTAWNFGLLDLRVLALAISPAFASDDTLFAATETGLYRSRNGGRAWRDVVLPVRDSVIVDVAVSPCYRHDRTFVVATEREGLLLTTNDGTTWSQVLAGQGGGTIGAIAVDIAPPADLRILVAIDGALLLTADRGRTRQSLLDHAEARCAITCIAAPDGLRDGASILIGLADGSVQRLHVPGRR